MKRKLFLTILIVAVLSCLFVIGVSAKAYDDSRTTIEYTDFDGTLHNVPVYSGTHTAEEVHAVINHDLALQTIFAQDIGAYTILADQNGDLMAFPTFYIILPKDHSTSYVAISEIKYDFVNTLVEGKTYSNGAIRYIEFPHGMTQVRANSVFGGSTEMYETNVTEIHIPSSVSSIGAGAFENKINNNKLKYVYIEAGNTISVISGGTFTGCTYLEYVQFENLTEITSLDGVANCNFTGTVDLSNCINLTSIGKSAFSNSKNLTLVKLSDSIETIADQVFYNCTNVKLSSSYLPANLKTIGAQFLYNCKNINSTFIFPECFESLGNEPFQDSVVEGGPTGKELNLVFLGKMSSVVYLNGNGHQKHAEKVTVYFAQNTLSEYNTNGFKVKPSGSSVTTVPGAIRVAFCAGTGAGTNGNVTGIEYIYLTNTDGTSYTADYVNNADYGFDFDNHKHFGAQQNIAPTCGKDGFNGVNCIVCDKPVGETVPATGLHTAEDDGNCETEVVCTVCEAVVKEAIAHVLGKVYSYENGYLSVGTLKVGCTNEGCEHGEKSEIPALATSKGYSQEQGAENGAIVFGITFNRDAISVYEKYLGTTIDFGLIASSVQDNSPLNEDASAKAGTVKSSFAGAEYSIFQIKLTDIESAQWDKLFHCGGYFVVNGEISYVNNKQHASTSALVSYNIVTTLVESKED